MTLSVGDSIPDATLFSPSDSGPLPTPTGELFAGRKIVLVGMPGAFTGTCHKSHLPGILQNRDAILAKGVDEIVVMTTNDAFVVKAWAEASGAAGKLRFVSDGNAEFVKKAGLEFDHSARGMGARSRRFAMLVDDGVVKSIHVEEQPGQATVSAGAEILKRL